MKDQADSILLPLIVKWLSVNEKLPNESFADYYNRAHQAISTASLPLLDAFDEMGGFAIEYLMTEYVAVSTPVKLLAEESYTHCAEQVAQLVADMAVGKQIAPHKLMAYSFLLSVHLMRIQNTANQNQPNLPIHEDHAQS